MNRFLTGIIVVGQLLSGIGLAAQAPVSFGAALPGEGWTVTTRWDYRVRMNGRYLGFANRELREIYRKDQVLPGGWAIEGDARLLGDTRKDGQLVAARLDNSERISFLLGRDGSVLEADDGFPRLRGFPTFPEGVLEPGDHWEAPLDILILAPDGERAVLHQIAAYTYKGEGQYMTRGAHLFDVSWALRYDGSNPEYSSFLRSVEGSHKVSLVVDADTLAPIMARDNLSERWIWTEGQVEQRDGFALIFWKGIPPLDRGGLIEEFVKEFGSTVVLDEGMPGAPVAPGGGSAGEDRNPGSGKALSDRAESGGIIVDDRLSHLDDGSGDVLIRENDRGVSVTLRNLHFRPDRAELIPDDRRMLDDLAAILRSIPGRTVIVRGHTASVGRPDDELNLSRERAKTVADELSRRGVDPRRLVYEGVGSTEPAASNENEDGRRLNRRVEFLILED